MSLKPRILLFQLYLHFFCTNFEFLEYHAKNDVSVGLHSWLLSPENYCYDLSVVNYHSLNKYLSCLNLELECILIKILENWNIYECPFTKGIKLILFWKRIFDKFGKSGNWNEKYFCLLLERKFCELIHTGFTQPRHDKAKLKNPK